MTLFNTKILFMVASSSRSVSQGAVQKTVREKIKNARQVEARERLWENITKGRSGIPGSGIPSDWSILTDFVNTRALLTQMRYTIWQRSETFQRVTQFSKYLFKQQAKRLDGGLSSSRGHNERPKLNSSTQSESQQQQWVSTMKPRRTGKCEIVCKDL